ncbi:MAG: hypothetical protein ABIV51_03820 [Saprospiraceae bacterium]
MDIANKILIFLIFFLVFQSCSDCDPRPIKIPAELEFSFYPERREYHVGDTICFSSSTDEDIFPAGFDVNSDEMVSQISAGQFHDYFSDSVYATDAAKKFGVFMKRGKEFPNPVSLQDVNIIGFSYLPEGHTFLAEVGIILKDTGAYTLIPGSGSIKTNVDERCEEFGIFLLKYQGDINNWMLLDSLSNVSSTPDSRRNRYTFIVCP